MAWKDVKIDSKLFTNVHETVLRRTNAAIENAFINESGGHSRFPGLVEFADLAGVAPTYLDEWRGDLIAESGSRVYRCDKNGNATDVTGVPVSGDGRTVFQPTDNELCMAKGGPIIRLANEATELLSPDAPESTHLGYVDEFLLAIDKHSGRFFHCDVGDFRTWNPLSVFSANGKPDDLNAMVVTPYREVMLAGVDSIEQFERLTSGSGAPFFRRWSVGEGIIAPYTLFSEDQGTWGINQDFELVRFTGQTSEPRSDEVGKTFEQIDNWAGAWATVVRVVGQKFIILQIPYATNSYGTEGITLLYDFRTKRWYQLFDWDAERAIPKRWPGWSHFRLWGRNFVGGNGKVLELTDTVHTNIGRIQRMLGRTAHIDTWGDSEIINVRARLRRGVGTVNDDPPKFALRVKRDNRIWTKWHEKSLGRAGQKDMMLEFGPMGHAKTWQFEWRVTDDCPVELVALWADVLGAENK